MSNKHMKMESRSTEEEEEEEEEDEGAWFNNDGQINGKSQAGIRFSKSGGVSRLTRLEKAFLLLIFLLTVALVVVIVALTIQLDKDDDVPNATSVQGGSQQGSSKVCLTSDCVTAAAAIQSKLDETVHPCDDFYQFSCGGWMKGRVIPADKSSLNTFQEIRDSVDITLKNLLELEISPTESNYTKKAKIYYASCLDYDRINQLGVQPFHDFINREFGGWPLTTPNWIESGFDMTDTIVKLNAYGLYPLAALYVNVNNRNSTKRIMKMDQMGLTLSSQKYYQVPRNDSVLVALEEFIYKYGAALGLADPNTARQEAKDIVDFEIEVANIMVPPEDRRDSNKLWNPMTLAEVHTAYGQIMDWKRYAHTIMETPGIDVTDITDDEIIINQSPSYYEKLIDVLNKTPKRTLVNYLIWRAIRTLHYTQGEVLDEIYRDFKMVLLGSSKSPPRYQTCVSAAMGDMGMAVGKLFIKENFDADSKTAALDMIKDLQDSFDQILRKNDWMDDATKQVAEEKNRYIDPKIGYPKEINNETYMMELYDNLALGDNYLENSLNIRQESYQRMMKNLRNPVDKSKANFAPPTVNAYYNSARNQIMFPAGILQPPFFKKTYPKYLNYGAIGMVIGHEITHGFDDRGRQYDKEGNLIQWWSEEAVERFKSKSQCIVDQYSNYTVESIDMNLNGINTQGENIADNGGLKQSYNAYRQWVSRTGQEEDALPGLSYTANQLFFINFAQVWCSLTRDGDLISRIRSGVHSPGRFRVIGTVQNLEDFSHVFQCPKTSAMNHPKKCSVW